MSPLPLSPLDEPARIMEPDLATDLKTCYVKIRSGSLLIRN